MLRTMAYPVAAVAASSIGALFYGWPERGAELRLPGTVEVQEVRLGSRLGGRIVEVLVREGENVEAGRVLVRFDDSEPRARLDQALARLSASETALREAVAGPRLEEKASSRAEVAVAEARLRRLRQGARPEEIEHARGELQAAEAELKGANRDWQRTRSLSARGYSTPADVDAADATRDRLMARARAAAAGLALLVAGTHPEQIKEAEAERDRLAARADLLDAGTRPEAIEAARARVAEQKALVEELRAQQAECIVASPSKAFVEVVAARPGDILAPGQTVVRVLRDDDRWVRAYVPETELGRIRLGRKVSVTCDSYPGRSFAGEVFQTATTSEFTPRNVQSRDERRHQVFGIKVRIDDPEGVFKGGMAAEVSVPLDEARSSVAMLRSPDK